MTSFLWAWIYKKFRINKKNYLNLYRPTQLKFERKTRAYLPFDDLIDQQNLILKSPYFFLSFSPFSSFYFFDSLLLLAIMALTTTIATVAGCSCWPPPLVMAPPPLPRALPFSPLPSSFSFPFTFSFFFSFPFSFSVSFSSLFPPDPSLALNHSTRKEDDPILTIIAN